MEGELERLPLKCKFRPSTCLSFYGSNRPLWSLLIPLLDICFRSAKPPSRFNFSILFRRAYTSHLLVTRIVSLFSCSHTPVIVGPGGNILVIGHRMSCSLPQLFEEQIAFASYTCNIFSPSRPGFGLWLPSINLWGSSVVRFVRSPCPCQVLDPGLYKQKVFHQFYPLAKRGVNENIPLARAASTSASQRPPTAGLYEYERSTNAILVGLALHCIRAISEVSLEQI